MDPSTIVMAMVSPAIFFSAGGLLALSLNARIMSIFNRVRALQALPSEKQTQESKKLEAVLKWRARHI